MAAVETIAQHIFNQAVAGSPFNPGVPVALANLIVSQAKHETENFTSNAFRINNNAVGYKRYIGSRYQLSGGITSSEGDPYGHYGSYQDSIKELIDWLYRRQREGIFPALTTIKTADQYGAALKNAQYFGDTAANYTAALKRWFKEYGPAAAGIGIGAALVVAGLVYLYYRKKQKI